jgi:hypothetical protein
MRRALMHRIVDADFILRRVLYSAPPGVLYDVILRGLRITEQEAVLAAQLQAGD